MRYALRQGIADMTIYVLWMVSVFVIVQGFQVGTHIRIRSPSSLSMMSSGASDMMVAYSAGQAG